MKPVICAFCKSPDILIEEATMSAVDRARLGGWNGVVRNGDHLVSIWEIQCVNCFAEYSVSKLAHKMLHHHNPEDSGWPSGLVEAIESGVLDEE